MYRLYLADIILQCSKSLVQDSGICVNLGHWVHGDNPGLISLDKHPKHCFNQTLYLLLGVKSSFYLMLWWTFPSRFLNPFCWLGKGWLASSLQLVKSFPFIPFFQEVGVRHTLKCEASVIKQSMWQFPL